MAGRRFGLCACIAAGAAISGEAQPPSFRSGVDVLAIDVAVRDSGGQPALNLRPEDFTVSLDGKPRHVVSAKLFQSAERPILAGGEPVPRYVTNTDSPSGRVIVFAIDTTSIEPGTARPLFETVSRAIERLGPGDAVGLVTLPAGGVELTRDHSRVRAAVEKLNSAPPVSPYSKPMTITGATYRVSWEEALAFERRDGRVMKEVLDRECADNDDLCRGALRRQATEMMVTGRVHVESTLTALTAVVSRLDSIDAPKDVVFISGGLYFGVDFASRYQRLAETAGRSKVVIHTVHVDQNTIDMSRFKESGMPDASRIDGVVSIAATTGGVFVSGNARATGAFDRLLTELRAVYQLGVETRPEDADGRPHRIAIAVARQGSSARYADHVIVSAPATATPAQRLARAVQQATDVAEVPLAVSTWTMHGKRTQARLLVSAEIGAPASVAPVEWAVVVLQGGKPIVKTGGPLHAGRERPHLSTTSLDLAPGSYRLRVVAIDADGHTGGLEIPIAVGLRGSDAARTSDLVVGTINGRELEARSRVSRQEVLSAMIEVSGADPSSLTGALQLIRGGTAAPALTVPLSVRARSGVAADVSAAIVLQTAASIAPLEPGRYTANAIIDAGGAPVARVSRLIDITDTPSTTVASASPGLSGPANSVDEAMQRVGAYVEQYGTEASVIISVERYRQHVMDADLMDAFRKGGWTSVGRGGEPYSSPDPSAGGNTAERRLVSELALVRNDTAIGGWLAYRDVIEVDGKAVGNRRDRLQALFGADLPDLEAAKRITAEGARFNLGPVTRTFNVPTAALFFFHPRNLSRFTFTRKGPETIDGVDAWKIDFQEARTPSLIAARGGADILSSGTLWVDPASGAVFRTLLFVGNRRSQSHAELDVLYHRDAALGMLVPAKMTELYFANRTDMAGEATYSDFQRFQTGARLK